MVYQTRESGCRRTNDDRREERNVDSGVKCLLRLGAAFPQVAMPLSQWDYNHTIKKTPTEYVIQWVFFMQNVNFKYRRITVREFPSVL